MRDLSIIIPTHNRAAHLDQCLNSIRLHVQCPHEVIVIDGASTDQTPQVLARHASHANLSLKVIREPAREGFVKAANKGFRAANARFLTWLNDDALALPNAYDNAVQQLAHADPKTALLALFHDTPATRNVALQAQSHNKTFRLLHVRGTLYANFGIAKKETFEKLGYFDERFYVNGADPDFSLKVWHAQLRVLPAFDAFIEHHELHDQRRLQDGNQPQTTGQAALDNQALFNKWNLPPKGLADFDPLRPNTLKGLNLPAISSKASSNKNAA